MVYIETSNLDGETNLKIRQASPDTATLASVDALQSFSGEIACEGPNRYIYEFTGSLATYDADGNQMKTVPLGPQHVLLRGAALRNTAWAHGVVVATGPDTKLMRNSSRPPIKT